MKHSKNSKSGYPTSAHRPCSLPSRPPGVLNNMVGAAAVSFNSWDGVSNGPVVMVLGWEMTGWIKKQIKNLNMNRKSKMS